MAPSGENLRDGTIGAKAAGRTATARRNSVVRVVRRVAGNFSVPARVPDVLIEPSLPVLLDARGAQTGKAMLVDGILPGEEFFDGQRVAAAGFLKRKEAAAHGSDDFGLAPDHPALGARRGQIGDRQRAAVRPDDVFGPWSKGLRHESTHALDFGNAGEMYRPRLKICLNGTLQLDHCRRNAAARLAARCRKSLELVDLRAFEQSPDAGGPLSVARASRKTMVFQWSEGCGQSHARARAARGSGAGKSGRRPIARRPAGVRSGSTTPYNKVTQSEPRPRRRASDLF